MTVLQDVVRELDVVGLRLRKAIPRGNDHLLLEVEEASGSIHAGQWHRDHALSRSLARRTRDTCGESSCEVLAGSGVVIQRQGADHFLPALQRLAAQPASHLLTHRAGARGVVRNPDRSYSKVVRLDRLLVLASGLARPATAKLAVPRITSVRADSATITTSPLPGQTLHERLADASLTDHDLERDCRAIADAVRELHRTRTARPPAAQMRPSHDAAAEIEVTQRWLQSATDYGLLTTNVWVGPLARAAALLDGRPTPSVLVHRDLHDKQILLAADHPVGLLDLELVTTGETALDLANLLAHLELRVLQGHCTAARAAGCHRALLAGYDPDKAVLARLPGYLLTTRLRLSAVYAFRPVSAELSAALSEPSRYQEQLP